LIDTALGSLDSRFASDTWKFFADVERALTAPNTSDDVGVISDFFGDDLDGDRLKLHIRPSMFHELLQQREFTGRPTSFGDIVDILKTDQTLRHLFPELTKLVYGFF